MSQKKKVLHQGQGFFTKKGEFCALFCILNFLQITILCHKSTEDAMANILVYHLSLP